MTRTRAFGIDGSRYIKLDWDVVAPYIDWADWKASEGTDWRDPSFADACQAAYDHKIPFGAFHYYRADYYTQFPMNDFTRWPSPENDLQLQNFVGALRFKKVHMIGLDIEETGNKGIDPKWIALGAKVLAGRIVDWLYRAYPVNPPQFKVYSRLTFINEYAPEINNWIHQYNTWAAQWTYSPGGTRISWEQIRNVMPDDSMKPRYFSIRPTWEFWQWSGDRFILPGVYNADGLPRTIDLNVYNGTKEQLYAWLNYSQEQPQPPEPPAPPPPADTVSRAEFDALVARFEAHTHQTGKPE